MTDPTPKDPTPDDAPEDFWADFGKFAAGKMGLFDEFVKAKNTAPAPGPNDDPPADPTPTPKKKKGWFDQSE